MGKKRQRSDFQSYSQKSLSICISSLVYFDHIVAQEIVPKTVHNEIIRGGGGAGGSEHYVQMFKMTLLLFKEYKCAKLF